MHPKVRDALRSPAYAGSRRAVPPFVLMVAGAAWLGGWGWWSLAAPLIVLGGLAAVGILVWALTRVLDRDTPSAHAQTPLDRADPSAKPVSAPGQAELEALRGQAGAAFSEWVETQLYVPIYRRAFPLRILCEQEEGADGVWLQTVAAIATVHHWTAADRAEIRRLLLSDAERTLADLGESCPFTPDTVEAEASVTGFTFAQTTPARAGLGLLELMPSWEPEHGVAIVLRDGKPVDVVNGLKQDLHEVFAEL